MCFSTLILEHSVYHLTIKIDAFFDFDINLSKGVNRGFSLVLIAKSKT